MKEFVIDDETLNGIKKIISSGEIAEISPERVWSETSRALKSSNPNLYFEKIISLGLLDRFFSKLKVPDCDNHVDQEIRWSELQINNNFDLGQNLPIPKNYNLGPGDELIISLWGESESYNSIFVSELICEGDENEFSIQSLS